MKKVCLLLVILLVTSCKDNFVKEFDGDASTNFEALWSALDQRYCYFEEKGIDWDAVYNEFKPKVNKCKDVYELFDLFSQMLDVLQDGHVNLYTPFDISSTRDFFDAYPLDYKSELINNYVDKLRVAGGVQYGKIDDYGYIRYSSFSNAVSASNMAYIDYYFKDTKGIIIDVRSNGGGSLDYSAKLAACFFKHKTKTGYIRHKTGVGHNDFSDYEPIYTDPEEALIDWSDKQVVVLTNRWCYSATNDFVNRLQHLKNVTIIGGLTGGGGGMPFSQELPNGWMVRFSAVPMYDVNKKTTEFGIAPHFEVHNTEEQMQIGKDNILDCAINFMKEGIFYGNND